MVQVIPRETKPQASKLNTILPWLSLLLVFIVLAAVFFFSLRIKAGNERLAELDKQLSEAKSQEQAETEKKLRTYKKKVNNMLDILRQRERAAMFYTFLEDLVHPNIYFTGLSLDMEKGIAVLEGLSKDFKSLGQQVAVFKNSDYVYDAQATAVSLVEEEGIGFTIEITLFEPEKENKQQ